MTSTWAVPWWFSAEEWQAIWAFATFAVALVAAFFALSQLRQNAHAQREQSRPYIVVDFVAPHGGQAIFIEVRNAGLTAAREIKLLWSDRPVISDTEAAHAMTRWVFEGPIPFLAPGRSIRYFLGPFPDEEHRDFVVKATCFGTDNKDWPSTSVLSFDQWGPAEVDRDSLDDIASHAKRLADATAKIQSELVRTNRLLDVVAGHFSETPEYKRSAARERIRRYEQSRMVRRLSSRTTRIAKDDTGAPQ